MIAHQQRLVIERVHRGRPAVHEEEDHTFGPRGERRKLRRKRIVLRRQRRLRQIRKQTRQREITKPAAAAPEHLAAG